MISISQEVLAEWETILSEGFNSGLAEACDQFDISDQIFLIDFAARGGDYFRAPYTLQQLFDAVAGNETDPDWPIFCASIQSAVDDHQQVPCHFNGPVTLRSGIYLRWPGRAPGDMETLPNAIESTLVSLISANFNGFAALRPGTLLIERDDPEYRTQQNAWFRGVHLTAELEITV